MHSCFLNVSSEAIKPLPGRQIEFEGHGAGTMEIEELRLSYRPKRIRTLFVGESAPLSGKFFYKEKEPTPLARHIETALRLAGLRNGGPFLERFKSLGWYLDDLVLVPVNGEPQ